MQDGVVLSRTNFPLHINEAQGPYQVDADRPLSVLGEVELHRERKATIGPLNVSSERGLTFNQDLGNSELKQKDVYADMLRIDLYEISPGKRTTYAFETGPGPESNVCPTVTWARTIRYQALEGTFTTHCMGVLTLNFEPRDSWYLTPGLEGLRSTPSMLTPGIQGNRKPTKPVRPGPESNGCPTPYKLNARAQGAYQVGADRPLPGLGGRAESDLESGPRRTKPTLVRKKRSTRVWKAVSWKIPKKGCSYSLRPGPESNGCPTQAPLYNQTIHHIIWVRTIRY
ncbi:hypothetical protein DFH06DRAFT_1135351 [Mycena polygramma]|nr:hypothetical protein DFH06DRAFT_1135351 [Mycena polygramma]